MTNAEDAKNKRKLRDDIEQVKELVEDADVVDVGKDTDYVPDSPRLQEQMGVSDNE